MSKKCETCGRSRTFGNNRSSSLGSSNRSWAPNIRRVRALVDGKPKRIDVCARCLRSGLVERPQFIKATKEE